MKWIDFFMWSAVLYALYYAVNIMKDASIGTRSAAETGAENVLHFTEHKAPSDATLVIPPEKPAEPAAQTPLMEPAAPPAAPVDTQTAPVNQTKSASPIEGQGVLIKEFWDLAQIDAVEFLNAASFA